MKHATKELALMELASMEQTTETDASGLHNSSYCDAVTPFSDVATLFSTLPAVATLACP
jgi:hypothetical protein